MFYAPRVLQRDYKTDKPIHRIESNRNRDDKRKESGVGWSGGRKGWLWRVSFSEKGSPLEGEKGSWEESFFWGGEKLCHTRWLEIRYRSFCPPFYAPSPPVMDETNRSTPAVAPSWPATSHGWLLRFRFGFFPAQGFYKIPAFSPGVSKGASLIALRSLLPSSFLSFSFYSIL